jgi:hypothetical protein
MNFAEAFETLGEENIRLELVQWSILVLVRKPYLLSEKGILFRLAA